jgi:hypothetical protein
MTVIEITRPARCKDCIFLDRIKVGKRIRHQCINEMSPHAGDFITLRDLVCDNWKLT